MSTEFTTTQVFPSGRMVRHTGEYPHYRGENGKEFPEAEQDELQAQLLAENYVNNEILCCDSSLVGELMAKEFDGFTIDDMENLYPDPSDWGVEECREYIEDHGGDTDHLPSVDPFDGWPNADKLANFLSAFFRPSMDGRKVHYGEFDWHEDDNGGKNLQFGIDEDGETYFETDGTGTLGDYETDFTIPQTMCPPLTVIAEKLLEDCKAMRREDFSPGDDDILDAWRQAVSDCAEPAEPYEWWRVSGWLCRQLRDIGEVVIDNDYGYWWGRTCTGQAMIMDGTLQAVARRHLERTASLV